MEDRPRSSRRVLRRFLHLAAIAFALAGEASTADAADADPSAFAVEPRDGSRRSEDGDDEGGAEPYRHEFPLRPFAAAVPGGGAGAHVRVLDAGGRKFVQLKLDGAAMVGPFRPGAYTVLVKAQGLTEVHRVRIGAGTLPYLQFADSA
jgi:hypothetical protein